MRKFRILRQVLKQTGTDKILSGFVIFFLIASAIIWRCEPGIKTYGDSLWYCFEIFSTIGFGDETAMTSVGRVLSFIISILSILVVAVITGVIVAFYNDLVSIRYKASKAEVIDKLEHLPDLSKDELRDLSDKIRKLKT